MNIKGQYKNGNYTVVIFDDGSKVRYTEDDEFKPEFAENCDVKITNRCSVGCRHCYEGCVKNGRHASLLGETAANIVNSLHPYTEMALNGNDLDHPELEGFMHLLKLKKVFCNITVSQSQFVQNHKKIKRWQELGLLYGVGVSVMNPTPEFAAIASDVKNVVLHVINGVVTMEQMEFLYDKGFKVLILGYKSLKRGKKYMDANADEVKKRQTDIYNALPTMSNHFAALSFDNLAIRQLNVRRLFDSEEEWEQFYMGDDGMFTFYIDLVSMEFAKSSLCENRHKIKKMNIDEMFNTIKNE